MAEPEQAGKKPPEIVDGEVVAEFTDDTFLNLPPVAESAAGMPLADLDAGRRGFILRMVLGGTAALALGGSAALLASRARRAPATQELILPYGSRVGEGEASANVAELVQRIADLEYELAAITAERDQARSELNAATTQAQSLQAQLDAALSELEQHRALNGLWQSLDAIGLDDLLRSALEAVGDALRTVLSVLAALNAGLTQGTSALQRFIQSLPGPSDGIRWLQQRVNALASDLAWLTQQVQQAVEPIEPFATQIGEFVVWVLERLPFGAGDKARAGMEAMKTVINSLPITVDGINQDVLDPLASWFGDDIRVNLTGTLITPLQDKVITPARSLASHVTDFDRTYRQELAGPIENALAQRAAIRAQIETLQARIGSHT